MKRIFILVTVLAVIAAGCKNYDDRFDDLNGQIATLTTQVQALQGVATQVTALNTEIGNIRSSIQEDIRTAVAGVSTTLNTSLTNAQTTLNGEIAKLQTALNDAAENSLSQDDIAKLKSELQTTLAAAQKTALDTALETLQARLTELEKTLNTAASGALSQEDLDKLKQEIETQLAQVKEDLEESLGEGGFHSGDVTINSSGSWEFTKRQLSDKTEFSGNFTIDTGSLTDAEVDDLIGWVAEITLINGDLTITHKDKDKVIKFAKLSSVTNLDDRQPHAHYPELTGVLGVSLSGDAFKETLSVKLPKITKTTFKDGQIVLPKLEQGDDDNGFDLSALASYEGDLTIQTNDKVDILLNALASIDAAKSSGTGRDKKLLTIDGGKNVHLDVLASVKGLIIEDVKHLEAPIVQEAELTIKGDVISVDIATGEGNKVNIKKLTIGEAGELKTLKFRGKSNLKDVVFRDTTTGDLETLEIHGLESVRLINLDELESLTTAGTIKSLTINNSSLEDELILGHSAGDNGVLRVLSNADITSLKADEVNKLKTLIIQGNSKLETLSFSKLKAAGTQTFGTGDDWYTKDAIIIGAYNQNGRYAFNEDLVNHLVAEAFLPKIEKDGNKPEIPGNIEDDHTGLEGLKDFLKSATRAIVSYDSAEEYSAARNEEDAKERAEGEEAPTDGSNLILFRKGLANQAGSSIAAKRVFVISAPDSASPGTITIGLRGGISRVVTLTTGGSLNNWVRDINDQEVKDFFDVNEIDIEATKGAVPSGNIRFDVDAYGTVTQTQDDDDIDNDLKGYLKLTIGEYSHEVHLTDGSEDDIAFARNRKAAKTYLDTDNSSEFVNLQGLLNTLAQPFPSLSTDPATANRGITNGKGITPYGVNDYDEPNGFLSYGTSDPSPIDKPITVTFENKLSQDDLLALVDDDADTNIKNGDYLVITLTSQKPGAEDSTIGQPTEANGGDNGLNNYRLAIIVGDTAENRGQAYVVSSTTNQVELSVGNILRKASAPVKGVDDQGKTTNRPGKDIDLFGDL